MWPAREICLIGAPSSVATGLFLALGSQQVLNCPLWPAVPFKHPTPKGLVATALDHGSVQPWALVAIPSV